MSCIPSISSRLSPEDLALAASQRLPFSSPEVRPSTVLRLQLMSKDENPRIRERAALDYKLTLPLQWFLATDPDQTVRACLARNRRLYREVMVELSRDESRRVRGFLAIHPNVPDEVLETLCDDPDGEVASLAQWWRKNRD